MDSVGTRQVTVVDGLRQVVGVRFSNDGTQLVIAGETESGGSGIFVVPRLGGALRRVAPGRVFDVRRGADTLLVVGTPGPTGALFARVVELATGRVTDSLALPSPNVSGVAWSPDGKRVVTIASGRVYVVDRSGQVTDSIESVFRSHVRWTPRGDAIVGFIPAPGLDDAFVRLGIDGRGKIEGQPVALLPRQQTLYRGEFDVAWRSGAVAYVGGIMMNAVMTFGLDNRGTPRIVAAATTYYDTPVLSPDGATLYLTRGDALGDNVYRVRLDAPQLAEEPLTTARGSAMFASLQVTADGQRVYFAQKDTGAPHARWIDPASGDQGADPIPAALDPMHVAMPVGANGLAQLGANGHRIQFSPRRGTPFRELQLADSIQVLSITGDADGRELGAVARVGSRVEVATIGLDPLRYEARTVLDGPSTSMRLSWHGDGDLYVARWIAGHGRPTLMRIPRTGARALPAGDVPASCRLSGTTVALRAPIGACLTADGRGDVRLIRVPGVEP
jgi:sugar lactone lactonase YvrE